MIGQEYVQNCRWARVHTVHQAAMELFSHYWGRVTVVCPVADPKILKGERRITIYQPRPHLSEMHTTIQVFYTEKVAFWKKWANGGRPHRPLESATG